MNEEERIHDRKLAERRAEEREWEDATSLEPGDHRTVANAMIEDAFDAFARAELAAWEERDREGRP